MDEFVARLNIEHFKNRLATETDDARRQVLQRLLAEEEAKLASVLAEREKVRRRP